MVDKRTLLRTENRILISDLKNIVSKERSLKGEVLNYLWVVQQKRIFATLGYSSLFEFCVDDLCYTEAEAQRRISAMKVLAEIPEIEEKINDGRLNLTSVSMAQTLFRREEKADSKMDRAAKVEVLKALENKSTRECEIEILKYSRAPIQPREKIKFISHDQVQITFTADVEFVENLKKLKELNSNRNPGATTFETLAELLAAAVAEKSQHDASVARKVKTQSKAAIRREVKRMGECQYIDPVSGKKCSSRHFLEIEHIIPKAMGGDDSRENLTLYCRSHNQASAISRFGFHHMDPYINTGQAG